MPVHVRSFYDKKDAGSDTESESRWGHPKVTSSVVVPPSESEIASSSVLSAPSSGFSSPKGSVRTSEFSSAVNVPKKQLFTFPNLLKPSRFVNALKRQKLTDKQSETNQQAVDLMTKLQRKNDIRLPVCNTVEKCDVWMSGCEYPKDSSNCAKMPILVDYSPSSNSSMVSTRSLATPFKRIINNENDNEANLPAKRLFESPSKGESETEAPRAAVFSKQSLSSKSPSLKLQAKKTQSKKTEQIFRANLVTQKTPAPLTDQQQQKPAGLPDPAPQPRTSQSLQELPAKTRDTETHRAECSTNLAFHLPNSASPSSQTKKTQTKKKAQISRANPVTQENSAPLTDQHQKPVGILDPAPPSSSSQSLQELPAIISDTETFSAECSQNLAPHLPNSASPSSQGKQSQAPAVSQKNSAPLPNQELHKVAKGVKPVDPTPDPSSSSCDTSQPSSGLRKRLPRTYAESDSEGEMFGGAISDCDEEWIPTDKSHVDEENYASDSESGAEDLALIEEGIERGPGDHDLEAGEEAANKITSRKLKAERKLMRNSGQPYVTSNGRNVPARERRQVHRCQNRKCHLIITDDVAETLFNEYWSQANYDKRVGYISTRVEYSTIERPRRRKFASNRTKEVTYKYYFDVNGVRHQVCKSTFLSVLGETDCFLRKCADKKKKSLSGITHDDRRGRATPKHALLPATKEEIVSHIKSFPAYVSHYCRSQTKQKYLSNSLNVQIMYDLFKAENPTLKISYSSYYRIFTSMKLKFKPPASDTCGTCDEFVIRIKSAQAEEDKQKLQADYELHLRKAEAGYALKRNIKALVKTDDSTRVLIFDLQQVLPTPLVPTGKAFYLRQLNTYNLTIVDCSSDKTFCYMWHECEGARGANQIASCLFSHMLHQVPDTVKKVYLFSDCCSGQNRNSIVSAMHHVTLQLHQSLKSIHHIFLVPGHTRMECDSMHSVIEASKSKATIIAVPQEWYSLVRGAGKECSFQVTEMKDQFFNFEELLSTSGPLVKREKKANGDQMYWTKTHWFHYKKAQPGIIQVKSSLNMDSPMDTYDMIRGRGKNRKLPPRWFLNFTTLTGGNAITVKKKNDLLSLLNFIDPIHHAFYHELKTDPTLVDDTDPDLPEITIED